MQLDIVVERQTVSYLEVIEVEDQLVQIFCEQVRAPRGPVAGYTEDVTVSEKQES